MSVPSLAERALAKLDDEFIEEVGATQRNVYEKVASGETLEKQRIDYKGRLRIVIAIHEALRADAEEVFRKAS